MFGGSTVIKFVKKMFFSINTRLLENLVTEYKKYRLSKGLGDNKHMGTSANLSFS